MAETRPSGRRPNELRAVDLRLGVAPFAEGSCLISMGETRVLCAASVQNSVPPWRDGSGGWVTAEYALLPRSTQERTRRERSGARGRTQEIQRLIGRALRAATDLEALGPRTVIVDCDVLAADGGTRTAAITGGCVALSEAMSGLLESGELTSHPMEAGLVAAVSAGIVDGKPLLDLDYTEDFAASVDLNVAGLEGGRIVEIQGTAEGAPFDRDQLDELMDLARQGIDELLTLQRRIAGPDR